MTGHHQPSKAVAWKCEDCLRLCVELDVGAPPEACPWCGGHLLWQPLRHREKPW